MEWSLRELMNLNRFNPNTDSYDGGPVVKQNTSSSYTKSGLGSPDDPTWEKEHHYEHISPLGASSGTPWGIIAAVAANNVAGFINGFGPDYSASDLSASAGTGTNSRMGISYTTQNAADSREVMKEYNKGTVGQLLSGNIGGAVSRWLWGSKKQREEIQEQNLQASRTNMFNGGIAASTAMRNNFAKQYGNQEDQMLFAEDGKDANGGTWAMVQPGETKDHDGKITTYFGGKTGQDSILDYVEGPDTIFSLKTPVGQIMTQLSMKVNKNTGKNLDLANRVARATVENAKVAQKEYRAIGDLPEEQVAHAAYGIDGWGNALQGIAGIGTAIGGFLQAKNSRVHKPDIRVNNPYEVRALNDLYSLRPDNLAINRQLREAEARGRYQIANSGGLRAGQSALANIAMTANTQDNIASAMAQSQDRFNALRGNAATAALNAGNAAAQRTQHALQYNDSSYQQAASARQNIMRDYLAQIPAMIGQTYKNYYTRMMGNNMLNLYWQDVKNRKA